MGAGTTVSRPSVLQKFGGYFSAATRKAAAVGGGAVKAAKKTKDAVIGTVKGVERAVVVGAQKTVAVAHKMVDAAKTAAESVKQNIKDLKRGLKDMKKSFTSFSAAGTRVGGLMGKIAFKIGKRILIDFLEESFVPVMALIWGYHYVCLIYDWVQVVRFLPKSSSSHFLHSHASFHVTPRRISDASLTYL